MFNGSMQSSFFKQSSPQGVDNKRLSSPGFFAQNSQSGQQTFGSAMLPTYPQQEFPRDQYADNGSSDSKDGLSYLVRLLRQNPAKLGL